MLFVIGSALFCMVMIHDCYATLFQDSSFIEFHGPDMLIITFVFMFMLVRKKEYFM